MIIEKIYESKGREIKQYPVHSNRASDLGIPCLRYHVLNRTRWQERALHDVGLQMIFDLGNDIEQIVLRELSEAGVTVIEQQRAFEWKEYNITGHLDGKILIDGEIYPLEIKSASPYVFKAINTIDDLKHGKYPYLRKYPAQLDLYMLMDNKPKGLFLFKDKASGAYKAIPMEIDYELGETLLKRAEAINAHVAAGTLPEPINEDMWCRDCPFRHICLPEQIGKEVEIDTGELAAMLDRLETLSPDYKEYDELNAQIKKMVEGREKVLAGDWLITGKWIEKQGYTKTVEPSRYWYKTIRKAV